MRMKSKTVMITDADSASGMILAKRFADEGADLILNSLSAGSKLQEVIAYCHIAGSRTHVVNMDLCALEETTHKLREATKALGEVNVLLLNNRLVLPIRIEDGKERDFVKIFNEHATTAFVCLQTVGKRMAEAGSGTILVAGSIHAEKPNGSSFAYSVSQGAVQMLVREAALTLGRSGVRVNYVQMGPVEGDNEVFQSNLSSLYQSYQHKIPSGDLIAYSDLAECALFLASDAARGVNGIDFRLDGGFVLHYLDHKMKHNEAVHPALGES